MAAPPDRPARRSTRLSGFDYSTAAGYVITICTHNRRPLFGHIAEGSMRVSPLGRIVEQEWQRTAHMRPKILLDEHIVMPNHFHAIVILQDGGKAGMPDLVRGFKAVVTRTVRERHPTTVSVWQRNYHDHIIRNDAELQRYREYIRNNPAKWSLDRYHLDGGGDR